jgi:hypothetical protein
MSNAMNFDHLVELCRLTHEEMQKQAVRAVDLTLVVRNWLFGRYIVEYEQNGADRAAYGAGLMDALTSRLKPFGIKGVSATRLRLYRSFFREYQEIQPTLSGELAKPALSSGIQPTPSVELAPAHQTTAELIKSVENLIRRFPLGWSHYVELLTLADPAERRFYEIEAAANQWTVRELQRQIATSLYQRLALSRDQQEIRRLATEGQVVEKAADLILAPTVRSKKAAHLLTAPTARSKKAAHLLPAPTVRSKNAAHLLPAPTVRSKQAQGIALGDNPKMIQALKGRPKPCHNHSPVCTSISSSAPRIVNDSSPDNKSITGRSHSKTNTEPSWCDTELISMNDMSGINVSPWAAPSGLHSLSSARPRALPWAGLVGPVGALEVARFEQITHELEGGENP